MGKGEGSERQRAGGELDGFGGRGREDEAAGAQGTARMEMNEAGRRSKRLPRAWGCDIRLEAVTTAPCCGERSLHFSNNGLKHGTG